MAGSYGYIFLVLEEIAKLLSQVAASSEEVWEFQLLHIHTNALSSGR